MELPSPQSAVAAVASFVRERLSEVGGTLGPLFGRRDNALGPDPRPSAGPGSTVVLTASAPFAHTSYGRARLLRQLHAGGLLVGEDRPDDGLAAPDRPALPANSSASC